MLRYFEYFTLLYLHVQTLRNAFIHVITYCISVIPIYWAFVIFGVLNFGPYSEKFSSTGQTIVTLFSLLNGDDIYATFQEIEDGQYPTPIISRIYIILFVTLFVTSVLNVFIFIIEDSYRTAKFSSNARVGSWCGVPPLATDEMGSKDGFTAREIMQIIFHNLETWMGRMEEFPVIYGLDNNNNTNNNSFFEANYENESINNEENYSILLEEFSDTHVDMEENISLPLQLNESNESNLNITQSIKDCKGNSKKLIEILKQQIDNNKSYFNKELQKKEEIHKLKSKYIEQETSILEICKALESSIE